MRLSTIIEFGPKFSRRALLQKAGRGLSSLLFPKFLKLGIAKETAAKLAGPEPPKLFLSASLVPNYLDTVDRELKDVSSCYNFLRKVTGQTNLISYTDYDDYALAVPVSPEKAAEILSTYETNYIDSDEGLYAEFSSRDINEVENSHMVANVKLISTDSHEWLEFENAKSASSPLETIRNWWNDYGKWGYGPAGKKARTILKSYGLDPMDRNKEMMRDTLSDVYMNPNELQNVDPEDYGFTKKEWSELQEKERYDRISDEGEIEMRPPRDYAAASPMHQWVENKHRLSAIYASSP